jgi:TRAP-type C4-dicarboxylate transport system permease small subunit
MSIAVFTVLTYALKGDCYTAIKSERVTEVFKLPYSFVYTILIISIGLTVLVLLYQLYQTITGKTYTEEESQKPKMEVI